MEGGRGTVLFYYRYFCFILIFSPAFGFLVIHHYSYSLSLPHPKDAEHSFPFSPKNMLPGTSLLSGEDTFTRQH